MFNTPRQQAVKESLTSGPDKWTPSAVKRVTDMFTGEAAALIAAVQEGFDAQVALTADLVRFPSVRGEERPAQEFMAAQMVKRGLEVDHFQIDLDKSVRCRAFQPPPFPMTTPSMLSELAARPIGAAVP